MSTVAISLRDVFGVAAECDVIFSPLDTPYADGAALTVSGARSVRLDAQGMGTATLLPGRYSVRFLGIAGNTDALSVTVPSDNATYPLAALAGSVGVIAAPPDYLRLSSLSAAGQALLTNADAAGQRATLGLGTAALFNVAASGNAAAGEVVKGDDTRLSPPVPEIWPMWQTRYFFYDPNTDNAAAALITQLRTACTGPNPRYSLPPGFAAVHTVPSNYPLFAIVFADNYDLYLMLSAAGNPMPCIVGMATWNGDISFKAGPPDGNDEFLLGLFQGSPGLSGDLNNDGTVDAKDYAILTELLSN